MTETLQAPRGRPSGDALANISRGMVRLHKRLYGRGPTRVRAYGFDDLVVVVVRDFYTDSERILREHGDEASVVRQRHAVAEVGAADARRLVETELQRGVHSYQTSIDPGLGAQVETFLLDPVEEAPAPTHPVDALAAQAMRAQRASAEVLEDHRALRAEQIQSREALRRSREGRRRSP